MFITKFKCGIIYNIFVTFIEFHPVIVKVVLNLFESQKIRKFDDKNQKWVQVYDSHQQVNVVGRRTCTYDVLRQSQNGFS